MKILVTGAAGFIGSAVVFRLLQDGHSVVGVDNHNAYYDPSLKEARVARFIDHSNYTHCRVDIADSAAIGNVFAIHQPSHVVALAAQAGVRYSLENPLAYVNSNVVGFANVLEECRRHQVIHLVYASSSSVYGANTKLPFSVSDGADHPVSIYAATKRSNELMAHAYSDLFDLPTTGLRFFTVYGPWGRPDMALFSFTKSIIEGQPISVFNEGRHKRDFTYIDDVVEVVAKVLNHVPKAGIEQMPLPSPATSRAPWRIYNVGSNRIVHLLDYISALERALDKKAVKIMKPLQAGDVLDTYADVSELFESIKYAPTTDIDQGIQNFVSWYLDYYKK
jgi:UDP-glucuronate 4-epimerase